MKVREYSVPSLSPSVLFNAGSILSLIPSSPAFSKNTLALLSCSLTYVLPAFSSSIRPSVSMLSSRGCENHRSIYGESPYTALASVTSKSPSVPGIMAAGSSVVRNPPASPSNTIPASVSFTCRLMPVILNWKEVPLPVPETETWGACPDSLHDSISFTVPASVAVLKTALPRMTASRGFSAVILTPSISSSAVRSTVLKENLKISHPGPVPSAKSESLKDAL